MIYDYTNMVYDVLAFVSVFSLVFSSKFVMQFAKYFIGAEMLFKIN